MSEESTSLHHPDGNVRRRWLVAGLAGLLATALTWAVGEAASDFFPQQKPTDPTTASADLAGFNRVIVKNAALCSGLQGALLGLTLGLAGAAVTRRSARAATTAGVTGLLLGGAAGSVGAFGLFSAYFTMVDPNTHDLIPTLLTHAGVASQVGAAAGTAFGLGFGGVRRVALAALGGLAGAAIGAALHQVLVALLFPNEEAGAPLTASWSPRLLVHALVDILAALGIAASVDSPRRPSADTL